MNFDSFSVWTASLAAVSAEHHGGLSISALHCSLDRYWKYTVSTNQTGTTLPVFSQSAGFTKSEDEVWSTRREVELVLNIPCKMCWCWSYSVVAAWLVHTLVFALKPIKSDFESLSCLFPLQHELKMATNEEKSSQKPHMQCSGLFITIDGFLWALLIQHRDKNQFTAAM